MAHGPTYYEGRGACIYCGDGTSKLTDEHIVPFALGGQHVLRKASCLPCADITKKFEQKVARDLWGHARTSYNAPTRRKHERKTDIHLNDPLIPGRVMAIPASEYPGVFVFYKMRSAGILFGLPEDIDTSGSWVLIAICDEPRQEAFLAKYPGRLVASFRHVPHDFGRLLLKIGYGQALTLLDPGDFDPICVPYILGQKQNVSYLVGGAAEDRAPQSGIGYNLETEFVGDAEALLVLATVRLYANTAAPTYQVVVGRVSGPQAVARVLDKTNAAGGFSVHPWSTRPLP